MACVPKGAGTKDAGGLVSADGEQAGDVGQPGQICDSPKMAPTSMLWLPA